MSTGRKMGAPCLDANLATDTFVPSRFGRDSTSLTKASGVTLQSQRQVLRSSETLSRGVMQWISKFRLIAALTAYRLPNLTQVRPYCQHPPRHDCSGARTDACCLRRQRGGIDLSTSCRAACRSGAAASTAAAPSASAATNNNPSSAFPCTGDNGHKVRRHRCGRGARV